MPDELVVELTQLTGYRTDLMADWVRGINRLRALLGSIFPRLEAAFDYSTRTPLILVSGLCTPAEIRAAGIDGVTAYLVENQRLADRDRQDRGRPRWRWPNAQRLACPARPAPPRWSSGSPPSCSSWTGEIKDIDKTITERFREHPYAHIIESLPGFGPGLGAEFLVVTRGDLESFATPGRLASYAGLVPVPKDSGRVSGNLRRPKRYNRRLRRVFYLAALSSLRTDGPSRRFYDRKRAERHIHTQALLALARRLVDVLWALLRDGREFTPEKPTAATAAA